MEREIQPMSEYISENLEYILELSQESFSLVVTAILCAVVLWGSVGIAIRNHKRTAGVVLSISNLFMAIPSMSLFGLLILLPGFGLSRQSAVAGLLVYAMLPIVRNIYVALNSVDPDVMEAARGMGMSNGMILRKVQLPLAMSVIFAGVRVALVMMVGISTLTVYIGERNLGLLISQGIARTNLTMIATGAVILSILAILVDIAAGGVQWLLIPKGLRIKRGGGVK